MCSKKTFVLLAVVLMATSSTASSANVFSDVWGIVTDPLKLDASSTTLSDSVDRSLIQLQALEGNANADVEERLEQIRQIIGEALSGGQAAVELAQQRMLELETKINVDAVRFLYRAQCLAEVAATDQAQRAYIDLIENTKKASPEIDILGVQFLKFKAKPVEIVDPDKAFFSTKKALLNNLNLTVTDASPAYEILSTYANLSRAAKFTRCHYQDQALEVRMTKEVNDLERLSLPWIQIVEPVQ